MPDISKEQWQDPGLLISSGLSAESLQRYSSYLKPEQVARLGRLRVLPSAKLAAARKIAKARAVREAKIKPATRAKLLQAGIIFQAARMAMQAALANRAKADPAAMLQRWAVLSRKSKPVPAANLARMKDARSAAASVSRFIIRSAKPTTLKEAELTVRKIFGLGVRSKLADAGLAFDTLYRRFKDDTYFVLTLNAPRAATRAQRFHIAAAVRVLGKFASVQPERLETLRLFGPPTTDPDDMTYPPQPRTDWHIGDIRAEDIDTLALPPGGKHGGEGVVIGHPDSGWQEHPEYDAAQIDRGHSYDAVNGGVGGDAAKHDVPDAVQSLNFLQQLTHGTGTASLMISSPAGEGRTKMDPMPAKLDEAVGPQRRTGENPDGAYVQITGVAPAAKVVPIRCITSVVLLGDVPLARAIEYAAGEGDPRLTKPVDVISISLGGSPNAGLEDVIKRAVEKGIIVVAAAGQLQFFSDAIFCQNVAAPGSYRDVICVTASTKERLPWSSSLHGASVDIAAPGVGTYQAGFGRDGKPVIGSGVGTSFSTAIMAGVAARWIAFWGRETLKAKYGSKPLAHVFRHMVMATADASPRTVKGVDYEWDTAAFGAGIVNVKKLLGMPLPDEAAVEAPPVPKDNVFSTLGRIFEALWPSPAGAGQALEDRKNSVVSFFQDSEQARAGLAQLTALGSFATARQVAEDLARQWEWFEAAALAGTAAARGLADESAAAWQEVASVVEEAAEQVAEDAEETAGTIVETVEEAVGTVAEGTTELVDAVAGALPHWP